MLKAGGVITPTKVHESALSQRYMIIKTHRGTEPMTGHSGEGTESVSARILVYVGPSSSQANIRLQGCETRTRYDLPILSRLGSSRPLRWIAVRDQESVRVVKGYAVDCDLITLSRPR